MREVCATRGSELLVADPDWVTDDDIARFDYIAFKENVSIAIAIAERLGIPRDVAMNGIVEAPPDPGVLRMKELAIGGKRVTWANLFAVNDRESMVAAMEKLEPYITETTTTVGILNNRADRERRAIQFADVAVRDLSFDRLVTFGAYEGLVTERLRANGYPAEPHHQPRRRTPPVTGRDRPPDDRRAADRARAGGRLRQHPHPSGRADARVLRARGAALVRRRVDSRRPARCRLEADGVLLPRRGG